MKTYFNLNTNEALRPYEPTLSGKKYFLKNGTNQAQRFASGRQCTFYSTSVAHLVLRLWQVVLRAGDIHVNYGPKFQSCCKNIVPRSFSAILCDFRGKSISMNCVQQMTPQS